MATKKTSAKKAPAPTSGSTDLATIEQEMAAESRAIAGRIQQPTGARIKVAKNKFTIPGHGETDVMDCVIVDFASRNDFFPGKFDPKNIVPPVCAAAGFAKHDELVPFDESPKKEADACGDCPNNVFGSDGDGKACKNSIMFALFPAEGYDEETPILTLSVAPASLKACNAYLSMLAGKEINPIRVITQVTFDQAPDYAKLEFQLRHPDEGGFENPFAAEMWKRKAEARKLLVAAPDFTREARKAPQAARAKGRGGRK